MNGGVISLRVSKSTQGKFQPTAVPRDRKPKADLPTEPADPKEQQESTNPKEQPDAKESIDLHRPHDLANSTDLPSASSTTTPIQQPQSTAFKIAPPTATTSTKIKPPLDDLSTYDQMNPMEITTLPMAAFIKNTRKGKKMHKPEPPALNESPDLPQSTTAPERPPPISTAEQTNAAPRLKIVDGRVSVDEDSLVVRTADSSSEGAELRAIVHETGQRVTSASFRTRAAQRERWTALETALFYEALEVCGTDFTLMAELFAQADRPKTQKQIKNKFNGEERNNGHKLTAALRKRRPLTEEFVREFRRAVKKE